MKTYVVIKRVNEEPFIEEVKVNIRKINLHKSKRIASKIINCNYVDGLSLYSGDYYVGGIYCDDMAMYRYDFNCNINNSKAYGTIVLINEFRKVNRDYAEIMLSKLKEVMSYG